MSSSPTVSSSAASLPVVQAQALGPLWPTMDPFLFCAHHDDAYPEGNDYDIEADERRLLFNLYLLERKRPHLQLVYFGGLDHEEHEYGPDSKEAYAGLERIDALIGRVRAAAEKSGNGRAVVCVVSDHGFARTSREMHLNTALAGAGLIELDDQGKVKSWRAMAWRSGGMSSMPGIL